MHRRLTSIALSAAAAAIVAGVLVAGGATAAPQKPAAAKAKAAGAPFRQVLAAKLGAQLDKPAADVLAALKSATRANKPDKAQRKARLEARAKGDKPSKAERTKRRSQAAATRKAFTDAVAKDLGVQPEAVTTAVQALVKERLDSLVEDGWLTAEQRDKRLSAGKLGIGFLRTGVR
jgi:type IV secretory pathway VirB10-like protein